ncbi:alcohol acetyltransferase [Truncatella angustata]|uniref:Alcohol acetyltransferase n=1 Tax=Truncatella angustata TaxID=152316 RepID=A0A9P8RGU2_9PEZI|nr:alcohol acetyltransferase [Truncatella angustata]KAH6645773.1 alcohol acetyltransferase [Truncatella angustata]KAH8197620.1 hypothetical protein TruAng_008204 [Truncatella angustata]
MLMRYASPNERRVITREHLGYYRSVVVGAVYDFGSKSVDLRSPSSYFWPLTSCLDEHPFLSVVIQDSNTEKPFYDHVQKVNINDHISIADDLNVDETVGLTETRSIETILGSGLDLSWPSHIPPWKILIHPIVSPTSTNPTRCFIAFSFSHSLSDGLAGPAFHHTFLNALRLGEQGKEVSEVVKTSGSLPVAFDIAERLPISWGFLLRPLLGVLLPKLIANFLGIRAATTAIDNGTWLGSPTFFKQHEYHSRYKLLEIEAALLQKILVESREHGAKLTATLHQVIIQALSRLIPASRATNFVSQTAVNMRKSVGVPENEMGSYVTGYDELHVRTDGAGSLSDTAWAAASTMTNNLASYAVRLQDQPIGLLRYAPSIKEYLTGKLGQKRDCSYEVSNLVAFSDTASNAGCKITKMVFAQPCNVVSAPLVFSIISVKGGSLILAISWQSGALDIAEEDENEFVKGLCELIKSSLQGLQ